MWFIDQMWPARDRQQLLLGDMIDSFGFSIIYTWLSFDEHTMCQTLLRTTQFLFYYTIYQPDDWTRSSLKFKAYLLCWDQVWPWSGRHQRFWRQMAGRIHDECICGQSKMVPWKSEKKIWCYRLFLIFNPPTRSV